MTTIITTTATAIAPILAIDLGKYKSVACIHDRASGAFRFTTLQTTRVELGKLIDKKQPGVVVIEGCLLAGWAEFHAGVDNLPPEEREVFQLLWYEELT